MWFGVPFETAIFIIQEIIDKSVCETNEIIVISLLKLIVFNYISDTASSTTFKQSPVDVYRSAKFSSTQHSSAIQNLKPGIYDKFIII